MACDARGVDRRRRWARMLGALGLFLTLGSGLACSGPDVEPMNSGTTQPVEVPPWACVPGETQPCPCEELDGIKTCNAEGSGFGECDCSPGAVSQGPQPTSTGTGTGSDTAGSGDSTADSTGGSSSGVIDPTTSGSSSGVVDPTTSGGSTSSTTTTV